MATASRRGSLYATRYPRLQAFMDRMHALPRADLLSTAEANKAKEHAQLMTRLRKTGRL